MSVKSHLQEPCRQRAGGVHPSELTVPMQERVNVLLTWPLLRTNRLSQNVLESRNSMRLSVARDVPDLTILLCGESLLYQALLCLSGRPDARATMVQCHTQPSLNSSMIQTLADILNIICDVDHILATAPRPSSHHSAPSVTRICGGPWYVVDSLVCISPLLACRASFMSPAASA